MADGATRHQAPAQFEYPADKPVILTSRMFDAPRALVWKAHMDGDLMARWWGPRRYKSIVEEFDPRVGGKWRITHTDGDAAYHFHGEFREVKAPEHFVWTFGFGMFEPAVEEYHFEERDGKTYLSAVSYFPSLETRDEMRQSGMEEGARETYEKLDELLEDLKSG